MLRVESVWRYERLRVELQAAHDASQSPEMPSEETKAALSDLLVRVRMNTKVSPTGSRG